MTRLILTCSWLGTEAGCGSIADETNVDYGDGTRVGTWRSETQGDPSGGDDDVATSPSELASDASVATAGGSVQSASGSSNAAATAGSSEPVDASAESAPADASASDTAEAPDGGADAAVMMEQPSQPDEPAEEVMEPAPEAPVETESGVTSVVFSVTTEPVGGRYRPKNIGAIWVTDEGGDFVRSLEVWARTRRRYLTNYNGARGSAAIDVTSTSTLTSHKAHTAEWDLTDLDGNAVEPGKYKLFAEVTDKDSTGALLSVDIDTAAGPTTLTPDDASGFTDMTVELK